MSAVSLRTVRAEIAKGDFATVYLLRGDDEFRKGVLVRQLIEAASDVSTRAFNLDVLRGAEVTAETLGSVLQTPPLMALRRVVVVKEVGELRKDVREVLNRYLQRPSRDAVVVLVVGAGSRDDTELPESGRLVEVGSLTELEASDWIETQVSVLGGGGISPAARGLLLEVVGRDAAQLNSELDKLVSYSMGQRIEVDAVEAVIGVQVDATLGGFLDRIAARDAIGALQLVEPILAQPKVSLVSVIMALTAQVLAMAWGRRARDAGLPAHQLEREFYTLLKETGAFPMRPWGEAVKCWAKHVHRWDHQSLDRAVYVLRDADHGAKDTRISTEEQYLRSLVCTLVGPVPPARAA